METHLMNGKHYEDFSSRIIINPMNLRMIVERVDKNFAEEVHRITDE